MKYLFRGGTVVSGRGTRRADILVEGEKILEVGRNITRKADQIIDVTRGRACTTGWSCGTGRPTAAPAATTAST